MTRQDDGMTIGDFSHNTSSPCIDPQSHFAASFDPQIMFPLARHINNDHPTFRSFENIPNGLVPQLDHNDANMVQGGIPGTSGALTYMTLPPMPTHGHDSLFEQPQQPTSQPYFDGLDEHRRVFEYPATQAMDQSGFGAVAGFVDDAELCILPYYGSTQSYPHSVEELGAAFATQGARSTEDSDAALTDGDDESDTSYQCYAKLIFDCLFKTKGHTRTLKEIYAWVYEKSPKVQAIQGSGWKNSVRHNLSMNAAFEKVKCDVASKKSSSWSLSNEALQSKKVLSTTRYRKAASRKPRRDGTHVVANSKRQESGAKGGQATREVQRKNKLQRSLRSGVVPNMECHYNRHYAPGADAMSMPSGVVDSRMATPQMPMPSTGSPFDFDPHWSQMSHQHYEPHPSSLQCLPQQRQYALKYDALPMLETAQPVNNFGHLNKGLSGQASTITSPHSIDAPDLTPDGPARPNDFGDDDPFSPSLYEDLEQAETYFDSAMPPSMSTYMPLENGAMDQAEAGIWC